jgi:hypothetical protein
MAALFVANYKVLSRFCAWLAVVLLHASLLRLTTAYSDEYLETSSFYYQSGLRMRNWFSIN